VAALYINTAMIFLDMRNIKTALRYLHRALTINSTVLGPGHMSTATTYHATAVALSMMRAAPLALKNEQKCYEILKELYGPQDPRVKESGEWLQHFTQRVAQAKVDQSKVAVAEEEAISSQTLKPVVFAQGGVREAQKTVSNGPVPTVKNPPRPKRGKASAVKGE